MQSTLVGGSAAGRLQGAKATLYVGGLSDNVNEAALHAAFIPFGEIKDVSIPIDNATGSHRGFGFVEFEEEGDAAAAALNMDAAEFFGRTLRVNQSQSRIGGGSKRDAVWADGDAWNERQAEADNDGGGGGLLGASGAFKRQEVGGGGGAAAAAAAREQPAAAAAAASDPMAAAEAALG